MARRERKEDVERERDDLRRENEELKRRLQERDQPSARTRRFPGGGQIYYVNTSKGF